MTSAIFFQSDSTQTTLNQLTTMGTWTQSNEMQEIFIVSIWTISIAKFTLICRENKPSNSGFISLCEHELRSMFI